MVPTGAGSATGLQPRWSPAGLSRKIAALSIGYYLTGGRQNVSGVIHCDRPSLGLNQVDQGASTQAGPNVVSLHDLAPASSLVTPVNPESGGPSVDGNWHLATPYPSAPYNQSCSPWAAGSRALI